MAAYVAVDSDLEVVMMRHDTSARGTDQIDQIPNWAAILFAAGLLAAGGGLVWMITNGDAKAIALTAAGVVAVLVSIGAAKHSMSNPKTEWTSL
jgi:hypothetical protein